MFNFGPHSLTGHICIVPFLSPLSALKFQVVRVPYLASQTVFENPFFTQHLFYTPHLLSQNGIVNKFHLTLHTIPCFKVVLILILA